MHQKTNFILFVTCLVFILFTACEVAPPEKLKKNPYKHLFKKPGQHQKENLPYQTVVKINID